MSTLKTKKVQLGDNADPSKNFVLSVPAVADGTLSIKRQDGTNVLSIDATGKAVIPGLVGTVSQSGGVPTGAIIERGSNANGEYVRYADGTQICRAIRTGNQNATTRVSTGLDLYYADETITLPASFVVEAPVCGISSARASADATATWLSLRNVELSTVTVRTYSSVSAPTLGNSRHIVAVGRWF